ncbi:MAG TPA: hypothetical protein VFI24_22180 [Pyrinomonadaceae bacterium]|nr:hypothetical protein [Pyrinomonadaceae bacterium]
MRSWKVCILILVAFALVFPYKSTVVPAWKLRIVDEKGKPYANIPATQAWKHNTLEINGIQNRDTRSTNPDGYVEFPERTIRAGVLMRIFLTILSALMTLAHGGFGVKAYIHASGPQGYAEVNYESGKPVPNQLILPSEN